MSLNEMYLETDVEIIVSPWNLACDSPTLLLRLQSNFEAIGQF